MGVHFRYRSPAVERTKMAKKAFKTSRPISAMLLGLAATLAVTAGYLFGLGDRAELQALDARFRLLGTAPPNDIILHVDIDDSSLDAVGRWPWPRAVLAEMIATLERCGAKAVALDVIFPEPQAVRFVSEADEVYSADFSRVGTAAPPRPVFDDYQLATRLADYKNIFLAMHMDFKAPAGGAPPMAGAVMADLQADPNASLQKVLADVLPEADANELTSPRTAAVKAYLRTRGLLALRRFMLPDSAIDGYPAPRGRVVPPLVIFADATRHGGFVTVDPDLDGVVRRIPLLAKDLEGAWPQLALALAAWELGGDAAEITADRTAVTINGPGGLHRVIPVDDDGRLLINWVRPGRIERAAIPAHSVIIVYKQQQKYRYNTDQTRLVCRELATMLGQSDLLTLYGRADELYQRINAAKRAALETMLFNPGKPVPDVAALQMQEAAVEADIDAACAKMIAPKNLNFYLGKPSPPADGQGDAAYQEAMAAYQENRQLIQPLLDHLTALLEANWQIAAQIQTLEAGIRERVSGKICLIGSTATGAADFVPTPVDKRTSGVIVHANIFNTIVSGVFVRQAGPVVNVAVIVVAGLLVALLTATGPVTRTALLTVLLAAGYVALNALVVFAVWDTWLVVVAPLAAMLASFLVVTAYRQLTEEHAKRHIRGMFAQALSPALVDRLIDDPSLAQLGGQKRVLTCLFSDLAGFTPLAEQLGENATVQLLNRYFDRMTNVIQTQRGGYLNKFLGDGIFVFFGAPVFQDDHAARAVAAAVDCQRAVEEFNAELAGEFDRPVTLTCRIGAATGEVMVGNCGSSDRMDYTAIGDTVNLASRLEAANKFFRTGVLVADETWQTGRSDALVARPLGQVIVVGRTVPETVWHVVGTHQHTPVSVQEAMETFAEAVELYAARKFPAAAEKLTAVLETLPDDKPAQIYIERCRQYIADPPGDDWDVAIRLTEK